MHERDKGAAKWDHLYEIAAAQDGLFTTSQASDAGYSPQLLAHHVTARRIVRVRRGVYRIVHFPSAEHEDLTAIWLWSERQGVFSHQTALALHDLSDILPARVHLTLPASWRIRRLRAPEDVALHFGDLTDDERRWFGAVPATSPVRTLNDCAAANLSPDLLRQAARQALTRGLVKRGDLGSVKTALAAFGGIGR